MSIGVCLTLSASFQISLSLAHTQTHSGMHAVCAHTSKHTQSSLALSQANANTSSAALSPRKQARTNIQAQCKSMVESRRRPMKNACPLACFIKNTHWDSIHISAEKPQRNINYVSSLGGSVGRNEAKAQYVIYTVILMKGSLYLHLQGQHCFRKL